MELEILKRIKETRESHRLTQSDMANSLEISIVSYSKIERGETKLTINHIERIANILGVSPYSLISSNDENTDIEALKKENEDLKKDIERYKGILDTYQDKIKFADTFESLMNKYEVRLTRIENSSKEEKENFKKKAEKAKEMLKDFKL